MGNYGRLIAMVRKAVVRGGPACYSALGFADWSQAERVVTFGDDDA